MKFSGLYINLDRSVERRQRLEAELARAGLRYDRLAATDGRAERPMLSDYKAAGYGCYMSHNRALRLASEADGPTHVLEDDAKVSPAMPKVIAAAVAGRLFDRFDMIFLDFQIPYGPKLWRHLRDAVKPGQVSVVNISDVAFMGTTSYLVSPAGAAKAREICVASYEREPRAIDLVMQQETMAGRLRVGTLVPFATSLDPAHATRSTIGNAPTNIATANFMLAMFLVRYSFFIDCNPADVAFIIERLSKAEAQPSPDQPYVRTIIDFIRGTQ